MIEGASPRTVLEAAMRALQPLPRDERFARVSLWTMYYFGALIVPAVTRAARTGRVPETAIDALVCAVDADGYVAGFQPKSDAATGGGLGDLVDRHLAVTIASCRKLTGFPSRVGWSNAAVVIDHAIGEAHAAGDPHEPVLREAEALIAAAGHPLLARPYTACPRRRRVCCLRCLLPEGSLCPEICPKDTRPDRRHPARALAAAPTLPT